LIILAVMPGLTLFGCKKKYIVFTKIKKLKKIGAGERIQNLDSVATIHAFQACAFSYFIS